MFRYIVALTLALTLQAADPAAGGSGTATKVSLGRTGSHKLGIGDWKAYRFTEANDNYAYAPHDASISPSDEDFWMIVAYRRHSTCTSFLSIVDKYTTNAGFQLLDNNNAYTRFRVADATDGAVQAVLPTPDPVGEWRFVYCEHDHGTHVGIELNASGTMTTTAKTGGVDTTTNNLRFGATQGNVSINVDIAFVLFGKGSGSLLTPNERKVIFNGGRGMTPEQLPADILAKVDSAWNFHTIDAVTDSVGSNDLTLTTAGADSNTFEGPATGRMSMGFDGDDFARAFPWVDLVGGGYAWTQSPAVSTEYYLTSGGGDPGLTSPDGLLRDDGGSSPYKTKLTAGVLGSLNSDEWAYGDNDSLGYNTIYVRVGSDPDVGIDIWGDWTGSAYSIPYDGIFTVSVWVRDDGSVNSGPVMERYDDTWAGSGALRQYEWALRGDATNSAYYWFNYNETITNYLALTSTSAPSTDYMDHVVITCDGTTGRMYVNGVEEATDTASGNIRQGAAPLEFGGINDGQREWTGAIAAGAKWNRELSAREVTELYSYGPLKYRELKNTGFNLTDLKFYYDLPGVNDPDEMDESSGLIDPAYGVLAATGGVNDPQERHANAIDVWGPRKPQASVLLGFNEGAGTTTFDHGYADNALSAVTFFGDAAIATTGGKYGNHVTFDGTGDYLRATNMPQLGGSTGKGDFTIDMWVYFTNKNNSGYLLHQQTDVNNYWYLNWSGTFGLQLKSVVSSTTEIDAQQGNTTGTSSAAWHHIRVTRKGDSFRFNIDGTYRHGFTDDGQFGSISNDLYIGVDSGTVTEHDGRIGLVYYVEGVALRPTGGISFTTPEEEPKQ